MTADEIEAEFRRRHQLRVREELLGHVGYVVREELVFDMSGEHLRVTRLSPLEITVRNADGSSATVKVDP